MIIYKIACESDAYRKVKKVQKLHISYKLVKIGRINGQTWQFRAFTVSGNKQLGNFVIFVGFGSYSKLVVIVEKLVELATYFRNSNYAILTYWLLCTNIVRMWKKPVKALSACAFHGTLPPFGNIPSKLNKMETFNHVLIDIKNANSKCLWNVDKTLGRRWRSLKAC